MRISILLAFLFSALGAAQPDHRIWDRVLDTYVSDSGQVNYKRLKEHPEDLLHYLDNLKENQPREDWSKAQILSYWINAYNAYTLKLIIDYYPIASIKDIKAPWDKKFISYN